MFMITYGSYTSGKYTMLHSKWASENPVFGETCSFIKVNDASKGLWFTNNCSKNFTVICMKQIHEYEFIIPEHSQTAILSTTHRTTSSSFTKSEFLIWNYYLSLFYIHFYICGCRTYRQ